MPIDTSRLQFLVVAPAEQLRKFEEGKPREFWGPRTDVNGEILWRVQLVALGDGEADIIRVSIAGEPKLTQGEMVRVEGMTAQAWEMDGRSGMTFRANAIRPVNPRAAGEKAAA
ncbi:MAG: hypothetical protein ABSG43_23975 [Solirubrobacteraceae bacterium]